MILLGDAYEQLVDRVLKNQHFGERWARHWLDVARFAESGGFELDGDAPQRLSIPGLRHQGV